MLEVVVGDAQMHADESRPRHHAREEVAADRGTQVLLRIVSDLR